jgi:hypothetical protein
MLNHFTNNGDNKVFDEYDMTESNIHLRGWWGVHQVEIAFIHDLWGSGHTEQGESLYFISELKKKKKARQ